MIYRVLLLLGAFYAQALKEYFVMATGVKRAEETWNKLIKIIRRIHTCILVRLNVLYNKKRIYTWKHMVFFISNPYRFPSFRLPPTSDKTILDNKLK